MVNIGLTVLLAALPLAVAGQNLAILGTGLLLIGSGTRSGKIGQIFSDKVVSRYFCLFGAYVLAGMAATWLNPENPANPFVAVGGVLGIWLLPGLLRINSAELQDAVGPFFKKSKNWLAILILIWGLLALSQMFFGWKIAGTSLGTTTLRAQGFYSHPLTLAYVALVIFPFATIWFLRRPKEWQPIAVFFGVLLLLVASKSRSAQAVGLLILAGNIWMNLQGRIRILVLAGLIASMTTVLMTDNPISKRFSQTIEGHDVSGDYIDDRVVFWQVHWEMFKERPLLGHGENLGTAYRTKYYDSLGWQDFRRKYEAHNIYLQILVNAGAIGLLLFMSWVVWMLVLLAKSPEVIWRAAPIQSILALLLGGMTQNAFQDSEVRYALMLCVVAVMLTARRHPRIKLPA